MAAELALLLQALEDNWEKALLTLVFVVLLSLAYQIRIGAKRAVAPALSKAEYKEFPLIHREDVSHNTRLFRFGLSHPRQSLGLPIGKHISVMAEGSDGEEIRRPYTPTTLSDTLGHFDLVVKVYPEGKMSQRMDKLRIGETLKFRGPLGRFNYTPNMKSYIGMIAGGTGITPMFQVIKAILENPSDKTMLSLVFGNITADDILLQDELDSFRRMHPDRFELLYILDKPPHGWTGGKGYVTPEMISERFAPINAQHGKDSSLILTCGPPGMKMAVRKHLETLGFTDDMQFEF